MPTSSVSSHGNAASRLFAITDPLLQDRPAVSLRAGNVLYPGYSTSGEIMDFASEYPNPAGQPNALDSGERLAVSCTGTAAQPRHAVEVAPGEAQLFLPFTFCQ